MRRWTTLPNYIGLLGLLTLMYRSEPTLLQTNALGQLLAVFALLFGATGVHQISRRRSLIMAITIVLLLGITTIGVVGGFMWYNTGTTTNVYSQR